MRFVLLLEEGKNNKIRNWFVYATLRTATARQGELELKSMERELVTRQLQFVTVTSCPISISVDVRLVCRQIDSNIVSINFIFFLVFFQQTFAVLLRACVSSISQSHRLTRQRSATLSPSTK